MKRVAIIGAGIAGLSAGIYARKAGFDVDVFEAHAIPGGLCTAWKRQGFVFDGCIHYLVGTHPESPFYRLWEEVGAIQERTFVYPEALVRVTDRAGRAASLYCDPSRLEAHLCDVSPADAAVSRRFCALVRALQRAPVPVDKAPELMGLFDTAKFMWALRPVMKDWSFCFETSIAQFAAQFRDPLLRQLLESPMAPQSPLLNLAATLGDLARKHAGYPLGGSLPFARSIEACLQRLGGKVHYQRRVVRITVPSRRVTGLDLEDGTHVDADFVIAAGDLRTTLDCLLGERFRSPAHERLFREQMLYPPSVQISFGLRRQYPQSLYVVSNHTELPSAIPMPGGQLTSLAWSSHDHDPSLAPEGGSVVSCVLPTDFGDWDAMGQGTRPYHDAKDSLARSVAQALEGPLPGFSQALQVVDVATPLTFRRYTGNYRGSYMTWLGTIQRERIPKEIPGLDGLLMTGMWVAAPGGLPPAVKSARDAVQILCKKTGVAFR